MKFGIVYHTGAFGIEPEQVTAIARHAEQRGFESFFTTEHIALYPGAAVGSASFPPSTPMADPLECWLRRGGHRADHARDGRAAGPVPPAGGAR